MYSRNWIQFTLSHRYCEKATIFEKNRPFFDYSLTSKQSGSFSNLCDLPEYQKFKLSKTIQVYSSTSIQVILVSVLLFNLRITFLACFDQIFLKSTLSGPMKPLLLIPISCFLFHSLLGSLAWQLIHGAGGTGAGRQFPPPPSRFWHIQKQNVFHEMTTSNLFLQNCTVRVRQSDLSVWWRFLFT